MELQRNMKSFLENEEVKEWKKRELAKFAD